MFSLFFALTLSLANANQQLPGKNLEITAENLKFTYQSFNRKNYVRCSHVIESQAAQDWKVVCGSKQYRVHLWVTVYQRSVEPRTSFEVLYWVTEMNGGLGGEATVWFHLKDPSEFHSMTVSQNVDKNAAGLYLDLVPPR